MSIKTVSLGELISLLYDSHSDEVSEYQINLPGNKLLVIKMSVSIENLDVKPISDSLTESTEEKITPRKGFKTKSKEKEFSGSKKIRKQIIRAMLYSKKHNVDFSKAIKKLYNRYASNWDYMIAEKLGYPDPRKNKKEPTHYDETITKNFFITKRTKILADIGWDYDEAKKAADEAWELGERDPDNFSKTKSAPPGKG